MYDDDIEVFYFEVYDGENLINEYVSQENIVQENFQHIYNYETIGDIFQINSFKYHLDSYVSQPIYDMYLDDLEYQFSQSAPVEVNIEPVYDEYESDSWEVNEGDEKELEEQLTHFYSSPFVE